MRMTLFLVAILLCVANVTAQDFPSPKPTDDHKVLMADEGTWDCDVKMFLQGAEGPATAFKGTEVNKLISGGLFVQTDFTCAMGDRLFEGHGLMGYDPQRKAYTGTWVDNFTAAPSQMLGKYDKSTRTLTVHSEVYDAATGQTLKQKQTTKWVDDSTKEFQIFLLIGSGEETTEIKLMEMTAKKLKP